MSRHDTRSREREIPVAEIVIDPAIQPRLGGIDTNHVDILAEAGSEAWPPLVVAERDGEYTLIDGRHRLEAATQLGIESVACRVDALPEDGDLRALAFSLNSAHGKPLTLADRKAEAERLLKAGSNASNNALAGRCGLSDKTVATIRERLERGSDIPNLTERTGLDGKRHPATRPRSTSATSGATSSTAPAQGAASENPGPTTGKTDTSMDALRRLVEYMADFLDRHAGDELYVYLADALKGRWQGPDRTEKANAMRTLGEQLIAAARLLKQSDEATTETTTEQEEAA